MTAAGRLEMAEREGLRPAPLAALRAAFTLLRRSGVALRHRSNPLSGISGSNPGTLGLGGTVLWVNPEDWEWRRGRDSNPRGAFTPAGFQDRCNRPLCHLSEVEHCLARGTGWQPGVARVAWRPREGGIDSDLRSSPFGRCLAATSCGGCAALSNPRGAFTPAGFQDRCNRPLCHLSEAEHCLARGAGWQPGAVPGLPAKGSLGAGYSACNA